VGIDKHARGRPAAQGLNADGAAAGEEIENAGADDRLAQAGEHGAPHPVHHRAGNSLRALHPQAASVSGNDAHLVRSGCSDEVEEEVPDLTGHAVDVAALVDNQVRWDWPLYGRIASAFKQASRDLNIPIVWGGDWTRLRDGPHFELNRATYP
jgi:hypothetical protein